MRNQLSERLEVGRIRTGKYGSNPSDGPWGVFEVQGPCGERLHILAAGGDNTRWEHVSVSTRRRPPNWQEMCWVKDLFWRDDECVVQFHPPKADYVNLHPHCLHMWRHVDGFPTPPAILVGPKGQS